MPNGGKAAAARAAATAVDGDRATGTQRTLKNRPRPQRSGPRPRTVLDHKSTCAVRTWSAAPDGPRVGRVRRPRPGRRPADGAYFVVPQPGSTLLHRSSHVDDEDDDENEHELPGLDFPATCAIGKSVRSAEGAATYQPRATPWELGVIAGSPEGARHPPERGLGPRWRPVRALALWNRQAGKPGGVDRMARRSRMGQGDRQQVLPPTLGREPGPGQVADRQQVLPPTLGREPGLGR